MRAPPGNAGTPAPSESDTNLSQERRAWADRNLDKAARALSLDEGGLFPDLVAADEPSAVDTFEDESLPLLSSKSATVGEK